MRLVPVALAHLIAPLAAPVATIPATAGRFLLPSETTAQALAEARAAGLALLAAGGELVFHGTEVDVEAGELVGGVGQVEGLVVRSPPVRVREDGVGLLEE